jgi:ABC-type transport system involved in multi-copper enzyme maturation permease subunit
MNILTYKALARSVVLESIRRKDLWVVAILGFLIILASSALGFFGFDGLQVFAKDLAVTVLGLFSTIIAILTSCRLIPDEIKNRTLYPLLARPITRLDLLVGKLIGAVVVTWISFLVLSALTAVALMVFQVKFETIMLQYMILKMIGLVLVCSVSLALSTYLTPSAGATMSFIFAFGCPMFVRALTMGYESAGPMSKPIFPIINALLPQFSLFDMGARAVYPNWSPIPVWIIGFMLGYAVLYSSAMVGLGWLKFRKQAV